MKTCFEQAAGTIELYFYGELDEAGRARAEQHLSTCADCRQALDELQVIRTALASRPDVAAPPGGDWSGFMTRLEAAVRHDGDESSSHSSTSFTRRHSVAYIAMAALLALVTVTVAQLARTRFATTDRRADEIGGSGARSAPWTEDAAFASLSEQHFDRAKLVVLGLANKGSSEAVPVEWEYERQLASNLLADTRLYRQAAEERGMNQLARIMGDLELVLLQASLSGDPQPETLAQIQSLIRKRDLVSRMNVMAVAGM